MSKNLLSTLARKNLKQNESILRPYFIASMIFVAIFHTFLCLLSLPMIQDRFQVKQLLIFGLVIMGLLIAIMLFYTYSFVVKRRRKEAALYSILGLEKKHLASMIFRENTLLFLSSFLAGVALSWLFTNLAFMVLSRLIKTKTEMVAPFSLEALVISFIFFAVITMINSIIHIARLVLVNPIQQMQTKNAGEKPMRFLGIKTLLGLAMVGTGYYLSLKSTKLFFAFKAFFPAVILVILGTELLFSAVSVFILKRMQKGKGYYAKPSRFLMVSGMLGRMRQNAQGMASVAILLSMLVVTMTTTLSLYRSIDKAVESRFPTEFSLYLQPKLYKEQQLEGMEIDPSIGSPAKLRAATKTNLEAIQKHAEATGNSVKDVQIDQHIYQRFVWEDNEIKLTGKAALDSSNMLQIYTVEDFNLAYQDDLQLKEGTALLWRGKLLDDKIIPELPESENDSDNADLVPWPERLKLGEKEYRRELMPKEYAEKIIRNGLNNQIEGFAFLILPSDQDIIDYSEWSEKHDGNKSWFFPSSYLSFNFEETVGFITQEQFEKEFKITLDNEENFGLLYGKEDNRHALTEGLGSFLFLGVFASIVFVVGLSLISWFKQYNEALEDRARYGIMRKVGLEDQLIRSTARSQVFWLFFLPLLVALCHAAFAIPLFRTFISQLLPINGGTTLYYQTLGFVVLGMIILYLFIYQLLVKMYRRMVG